MSQENLFADLVESPKEEENLFADLAPPQENLFADLAVKQKPSEGSIAMASKMAANAFMKVFPFTQQVETVALSLEKPTEKYIASPTVKTLGTILGWVDAFERNTLGRFKKALLPERIKSKLPAAPSEMEIWEGIEPDLRYILEEVGINKPSILESVTAPDGQLVGLNFREGRDITKPLKFAYGLSTALSSPSNILLSSSLAVKGFSTLAKTEVGQMAVGKIIRSLPEGLQKGLQIGKFSVPEELDDILFDREVKIARWIKAGTKITDDMLELTPAERTFIRNLRVTEMVSETPELAKLRTKEAQMGRFVDLLSKKYAESGIPNEEQAELIMGNLKEYLPRLYSSIEKETGKKGIPSDILERIWDLSDKQVAALSRLNPELGEKLASTLNKVSEPIRYDASGFKSLRIRGQERLKTRMERKLASVEIEKIETEQAALREKISEFSVFKMKQLQSVSPKEIKKIGMDTDELAQLFTAEDTIRLSETGANNFQKFIAAHPHIGDFLSKVNKEPSKSSIEWVKKVSDEAKELIGQRNKLEGRWGNLQGMKGMIPEKVLSETENYRYALGEIKDPAVLLSKLVPQMANSIETAEAFTKIAQNPKWVLGVDAGAELASQTGARFVKMGKSPQLGVISERFVRDDIANAINETVQAINTVPTNLMKAMQFWKFGKVVLNPATHFRNLMSNTILLEISGVPESSILPLLYRSMQEMQHGGRYLTLAERNGAMINSYASSELMKVYKGLLNAPKDVDTWSKMAHAVAVGADKAGSVYQAEEQWFKMAKFIWEVEHGATPANAAKMVQEALFNYEKVPSIIRKARSSPWGTPFITFPYKALPAIYKAIDKNPLSILKYELLLKAIDRGTTFSRGMTLEQAQAEKELAMKDDNIITRAIRLPFADKENNPYFLDLTYLLPWGDIGEMGNVKWLPGAITPLGLAKPAVDLYYNRDFFGKDIQRPEHSFNENAQNVSRHLIRSYLPSLVPGGYGWDRIRSAINGMSDKQTLAPQSVPAALLDKLMGLKARPVNVERMTHISMAMLQTGITKLEGEGKKAMMDLQNNIITEQQYEVRRIEILKNINTLVDKFRNLQGKLGSLPKR